MILQIIKHKQGGILVDKVVFNLVEQMKQFGAPEAHMTINNIKHIEGLTTVISVYDKQKPAHMVLEELYEWAEESEMSIIKRKIEELCDDMSWNEENPL